MSVPVSRVPVSRPVSRREALSVKVSLQYPMWKLFLATAVVGLLFGVSHPTEIIPAIATFVAAGSLVGLILLGSRANLGSIWRSVVWTLLGAYVGSLFSPSPPFHEPLGYLLYGALIGWAVGIVVGRKAKRGT